MSINKSGNRGNTGARPKYLPVLLRIYEGKDFGTKRKAVFLYYLLFAAIVSILLIVTYTAISQLHTEAYHGRLYLPILLSESLLLIVFSACFILLKKGLFELSAHLFLISIISGVWTSMWLDKADALTRLDTLFLIMAALTMLPLLVNRYKWIIPVYILANMLMTAIYILVNMNSIDSPRTSLYEYLAEVTIAMIFLGIVGYNIFRINKQALDKAEDDFEAKLMAEKALIESEKKYGEITEMLPQTVFETDLKGRLSYLNHTGTLLFGIDQDDIKQGISVFMAIEKRDRHKAIEEFRLSLNNQSLNNVSYRAVKNDGTLIPVEIYTKPFRKNNKIAGLRGVIVDISDRDLAERTLRASEEKYKALMEGLNEVILMADNNCVVQYVNKQFTEKLGFTPEEIIGKQGNLILHDEDEQVRLEVINIQRQAGQSSVYEMTFKAKNGNKVDFLISGAPYRNVQGEIIGSVGAMMDISEHRKAERALSQSRQQFEILASMSPVGIFRTSADGYTTYVNPKWEEISGLTSEEALGNGWLQAVHPEDRNNIIAKWNMDSSARSDSVAEYRFIRRDGKTSWVLGNAVPEIVDGELKGYIGTITDITENKQVLEELEKYRNHLEALVAERTLDLKKVNEKLVSTNAEIEQQRKELQEAYDHLREAQDKLIHAEKMASLGVLAAGIAHEINNPLNFINGGAMGLESFIKDNMNDRQGEVAPLLEGIQVGVKRAAEIVSSLNLYSRRDDLPGSECNIHTIIDNCLVMVQNEIKYRIDIEKDYSACSVIVFGNEGRLHQVFLNIITNAMHAIDGKGTIKISTKTRDNLCTIAITDNGCGINKELIPRITDPFFTTKDPGKGTGLGLSITYNILKDYNGTIEFDSEPGKGTTVFITLPSYEKTKATGKIN